MKFLGIAVVSHPAPSDKAVVIFSFFACISVWNHEQPTRKDESAIFMVVNHSMHELQGGFALR